MTDIVVYDRTAADIMVFDPDESDILVWSLLLLPGFKSIIECTVTVVSQRECDACL